MKTLIVSILFVSILPNIIIGQEKDSLKIDISTIPHRYVVIKEHPNLSLLSLSLFGSVFIAKSWVDRNRYIEAEENAKELGMEDEQRDYRDKKHKATASLVWGSIITTAITYFALKSSYRRIRVLPDTVQGTNLGMKMTYTF